MQFHHKGNLDEGQSWLAFIFLLTMSPKSGQAGQSIAHTGTKLNTRDLTIYCGPQAGPTKGYEAYLPGERKPGRRNLHFPTRYSGTNPGESARALRSWIIRSNRNEPGVYFQESVETAKRAKQ